MPHKLMRSQAKKRPVGLGPDAGQRKRARALGARARQRAARSSAWQDGDRVSRVALVEVGPFSLFAHWDARSPGVEAARRRVRDPMATLVLRFREQSAAGRGDRELRFDVELDGRQGTRTVGIEAPFRMLRCELGVRSHQGRFTALARSNLVQTPREGLSDRYEERFRKILSGSDQHWRSRASRAAAAETDGIPVAEAVVEVETDAAPENLALATAPGPAPRFPPCPEPGGPAFPPGGGGPGGEGGAGTSPQVPFGYQVAAGSPVPQLGPDDLALELHAEVVIYGRGRPGSVVYVSGLRVNVRSDGTFEARFALPAGQFGPLTSPDRRLGEKGS